MFFNRIHCFWGFFLFLFHLQQALALTFTPIVGPFVAGAQVPIQWTFDGFEPANGWELWFSAGGSAIKLLNVPPLTLSTVVPFPGSNGTFQGLSGTIILATSNEVDVATPVFTTATTTFSASIISGSGSVSAGSSSSDGAAATSPPSQTSAAESATASKSPAFTTEALLGIVAGTLAVIAVIVLASVLLFVRRRRQAAAASNAYPFQAPDVEKQLDGRISPFDFQAGPPPQDPLPPPPRGSSLPLQPPAPPLDLRRQAYLNSQLQKLEVPQPNSNHPRESIVFGPLSSVPSESMPRAFDGEGEPPPSSPPLPPIPELSSRRAAYLREQLQRLAVPERRPSDGSVVFGPLSSVPSESTAQPYAPSVSTATNSPIQFLRHAPSQMTSPVSPTARRW